MDILTVDYENDWPRYLEYVAALAPYGIETMGFFQWKEINGKDGRD